MRILINTLLLGIIVVLGAGCGTINIPHGGVQPGLVYGNGTYPSLKDSHTRFEFGSDDIEVLGTVTGGGESFNVLFLFSAGDNGYQQLLRDAKEMYPDMDALINFYWDTKFFNIGWPYPPLPLYQRATSEVTATVVRFKQQ
jgi:hypothetical protein